MALASGVDTIAAFRVASDWWTAVDVKQANRGICILNDTLPIGSPELVPDNCLGSAWQKGGDLGNTVVDGDVNVDLRYNSFTEWFAMAMGALSTTSLGDGAYYHLLTLTDNIDGYFGTYCVYDGIDVREVPSMKIRGFELNAQPGQPITARWMTMCDDRLFPGVVNATNLTGVTYHTQEPRIMWDDLKIRINEQSAGALADSDSFYASAMTFTFERPMEAPFVTNRRGTRSEPIANGKPNITIALTEDAWRNTTRVAQLRSRTALKMDIEAIGATLIGASTTIYHKMLIQFPAVFWSSVAAPINGPTRIVPDLVLTAEETTTAPTGMTTPSNLLLPFRLSLWNSSTNEHISGA